MGDGMWGGAAQRTRGSPPHSDTSSAPPAARAVADGPDRVFGGGRCTLLYTAYAMARTPSPLISASILLLTTCSPRHAGSGLRDCATVLGTRACESASEIAARMATTDEFALRFGLDTLSPKIWVAKRDGRCRTHASFVHAKHIKGSAVLHRWMDDAYRSIHSRVQNPGLTPARCCHHLPGLPGRANMQQILKRGCNMFLQLR